MIKLLHLQQKHKKEVCRVQHIVLQVFRLVSQLTGAFILGFGNLLLVCVCVCVHHR